MDQYKNIIQKVFDEGSWCEGRNGRTLNIFGHYMEFYMADGFPIVTEKQTYWKTAIKEMKVFMSGKTSVEDFRKLGVKVWDGNANEKSWIENPYNTHDGNLGPIYGKQWRRWPCYKMIPEDNTHAIGAAKHEGYRMIGKRHDPEKGWCGLYYGELDMLYQVYKQLMDTPTSRRIIFHAWNPAEIDEMSLPPCHLLYQFGIDVERNRLSLHVYVRSNDIGLGMPFNIVESAFLLHFMARTRGLTPYKLSYSIGDAHIYENQIDMCKEILSRESLPLPTIKFGKSIPDYNNPNDPTPFASVLDTWDPDDVVLENYKHHPPISVAMVA